MLPGTAFPSDHDADVDVVMPPADNVVQNWGFESGSSSWQFGGSLTGTITDSVKHSGASAAFLGSEANPLQSITTLAGPAAQGESLYMDSAIDADGVIHSIWLGPDSHIMYSSKSSGRSLVSSGASSGTECS